MRIDWTCFVPSKNTIEILADIPSDGTNCASASHKGGMGCVGYMIRSSDKRLWSESKIPSEALERKTESRRTKCKLVERRMSWITENDQ